MRDIIDMSCVIIAAAMGCIGAALALVSVFKSAFEFLTGTPVVWLILIVLMLAAFFRGLYVVIRSH